MSFPLDDDDTLEMVFGPDGEFQIVPKSGKRVAPVSAPKAPRNNDGRRSCWWCGSPTRKAGAMGEYDVCTKKGCER